MVTAAHEAYGSPGWNTGRGRSSPEGAGPWWNSRPFWIAATVLAFLTCWPLGLVFLGFLIGSGRMGCRGRTAQAGAGDSAGPWWGGPGGGWRGFCGERPAPSSGNRAFDEYRAETLRRLEEEQRAFTEFLDRLRFAKDKAEFDAFMAERRQRPGSEAPPSEPPTG
jgi:Protein of unknown function (DUF2852)